MMGRIRRYNVDTIVRYETRIGTSYFVENCSPQSLVHKMRSSCFIWSIYGFFLAKAIGFGALGLCGGLGGGRDKVVRQMVVVHGKVV
jgi:hypothetical protein